MLWYTQVTEAKWCQFNTKTNIYCKYLLRSIAIVFDLKRSCALNRNVCCAFQRKIFCLNANANGLRLTQRRLCLNVAFDRNTIVRLNAKPLLRFNSKFLANKRNNVCNLPQILFAI